MVFAMKNWIKQTLVLVQEGFIFIYVRMACIVEYAKVILSRTNLSIHVFLQRCEKIGV